MQTLPHFKEKTSIVSFHIGRGKFNNPGHKTYNPTITTLQDCFREDTILIDTDSDGNPLPDDECRLTDTGGNTILKGRDAIESDTGTLEWDGDYDTDIVKYIEDCNEEELQILYQSVLDGDIRGDLRDFVCQATGHRHVNHIQSYPSNIRILYNGSELENQYYDDWSFRDDEGTGYTEEDAREHFTDSGYTPESIDGIISTLHTLQWID